MNPPSSNLRHILPAPTISSISSQATSELDKQILATLNGLGEAKITLVEWEAHLLSRLGVPDFVFLVRDDQLEEANQIATRNGLINVGHDAFPPAFALERARIGHIYGTRDNRFILAPISYTGIDMDELVIRDRSKLPWIVHTVPFPAFCTACVRIISREEPGTMIAHALEADLNSAIKSRYDMGEPKICWGEKPQTVDYGGVAHMISAKGTFRTVRSLEFHWQVASWPFKEGESWMVQAIISWYYEGKELPTARDDLD